MTPVRTLRRLFGLTPTIYIHPLYLRPARLQQASAVLWEWTLDTIGWQLARELGRRSLLFDPRYGLVGDGPSALIQRRTKL